MASSREGYTNLNAIKQTSTVTFDDNTTTTADDVWFRVDLKITEEPNINISESIKALPNIKGFGNLHSLRNAMSIDNDLADTIRNYISLTPQEKAEQIENVIFK